MESDLRAVWRLVKSFGLVAMIPTAVWSAGVFMLNLKNDVYDFAERVETLESAQGKDFDKMDRRMENLEKKIDKIWQHLAK